MVETLLSGAVGGLISGSLFGNNTTVVNNTVYRDVHRNDLIEYHQWLEKRRENEISKDNENISHLISSIKNTCPKCVGKIEWKLDTMSVPEGKIARVRVWCKCKNYKKTFDIPIFHDLVEDDNALNEIRSYLNDCFVEIRGQVDEDKIRKEYLESKVEKRTEMEKYYGKI